MPGYKRNLTLQTAIQIIQPFVYIHHLYLYFLTSLFPGKDIHLFLSLKFPFKITIYPYAA